MRSSQGAATSDLAVHRTLRVGFSPVAAAARRGAARARGANAAHALLSAATGRQRASTRMNTRRRMFCTTALRSAARHELGILSNGIQTWMTGPRKPVPKLSSHRAVENMRQRRLPSLDFVFLLASVLHAASKPRKRARHPLLCRYSCHSCQSRLVSTTSNSCCSAAIGACAWHVSPHQGCASYSF